MPFLFKIVLEFQITKSQCRLGYGKNIYCYVIYLIFILEAYEIFYYWPLYNTGSTFTCFDGSKTIDFSKVNDDFCDCLDGSDEPGTSACQKGVFHCMNLGYKPEDIPSSRVNDQICDCCDGSDEWDSAVDCPNICERVGAKYREEEQRKAAVIRKGYEKRTQLAIEGEKLKEERSKGINDLKKERDSLLPMREKLEIAKKELEEKEKEIREKHAKEWEVKKQEQAEVLFKKLDINGDGKYDVLILFLICSFFKKSLKKLMSNVENWMVGYSELFRFYLMRVCSIKLLYICEIIFREAETFLNGDYGTDNAWASLKGSCFEMDEGQYVYRLCLFDKAIQKDRNSQAETSLGTWRQWSGKDSNKYTEQQYDKGQQCWNGPERSTKVVVECGEETALVEATEPAKCEYKFVLTSPAACPDPSSLTEHEEL
uniref:Glucosidase 2 subunit beta n=1 Tax=Syphacia muris TaxID=451379 RepID=A0A0N5ADW0_9BILA